VGPLSVRQQLQLVVLSELLLVAVLQAVSLGGLLVVLLLGLVAIQ
jgi:hypothetical protein